MRHALAVLLSAFLLFQVQPLLGKFILPWFGGVPSVWTTCMLFFQIVLLAGYLYAHLLVRHLRPARQGVVHGGLLVAAALLLPIVPDSGWRPLGSDDPVPRILGLLTVTVGLPFFALSATAPLLQGWFAREFPTRSPYWLYALSNAGSLLALVTYPFVFEPWLGLQHQAWIWSGGFVLLAVLVGYTAWRTAQTPMKSSPADVKTASAAPLPNLRRFLVWVALSACSCAMLLSSTNHICQDVAPMPFLWVLPLTLYLLSFIQAFSLPRLYHRGVYAPLWVVMLLLSATTLFTTEMSLLTLLTLSSLTLYLGCVICHGELYLLRPDGEYLTAFYLALGIGGALGGLFVGILAPMLFTTYAELPIACVASLVAMFIAYAFRPPRLWYRYRTPGRIILLGVPLLLVGYLIGLFAYQHYTVTNWMNYAERNFFGVLWISQRGDDNPANEYFMLVHGTTIHGAQFTHRDRRREPTTFFTAKSGAGLVLNHWPQSADLPRRVGVIGLGVGTLTTYGRAGDYYRVYEIDPKTVRIASDKFAFLRDCQARCEVVVGDARLSLEHELTSRGSQQFDVLIIDAFNSDAIPSHLLTREAGEVYAQHLRPTGVLAIHISNRHIDLCPVVAGLAQHLGMAARMVEDFSPRETKNRSSDFVPPIYSSVYVLLTRKADAFELPALADRVKPLRLKRSAVLWTDDFSNVFGLLR